jgi:hypothetical protein
MVSYVTVKVLSVQQDVYIFLVLKINTPVQLHEDLT